MGKLIYGRDLKDKKLFKITNKTEIHHNFQYSTGVNTDVLPFNDDIKDDCCKGGLYFSKAEDIFRWINSDSSCIREVTISDDEVIVRQQNKYRAHTIILGERMPLLKVSTWEYLVEQGIDINADDNYALRWAAGCGYLDIVKYLVEHGADVHAHDNHALRWATGRGYLDIVKYLVEHGADIHAQEDYALRWAAVNDRLEVVKYLVEHGADIHANNNHALRWAAGCGYLDIVKYLEEQGVE